MESNHQAPAARAGSRETVMTEPLAELAARTAAGETLSDADANALATTTDILSLGLLADEARRRKHGVVTTFVRVFDVNLPVEEGPLAAPPAAGEIRLVGVAASCGSAVDAVRRVVGIAKGVPVSAFSLSAISALAEREGTRLVDCLRALRDAGLDLVAEAPLDELLDVRAAFLAAREAGLPIARVTITHPAPVASRLALMRLAASLQGELGSIQSLAPLPREFDASSPTTGYEDVRFVAATRLLVDNVPSIQVDWSRYGPKLAQVALTCGADDIDAVSAVDDTHQGPRRAPLEEVRRNIKAASLEPVERDGRYQRIVR